jgi:hypothetical protein
MGNVLANGIYVVQAKMASSRLWGTSAAANDELIEHWRGFVLDTAKPRKRLEKGDFLNQSIVMLSSTLGISWS